MNLRQAIFPENPHALYKKHNYSPAILSGDLLFASGMVGAREEGAPEPDLDAQIQLAFENLGAVLEAAGGTFENVVDVTIFMIDPEASVEPALAAMKKAFTTEPPPNITAVGNGWMSLILRSIADSGETIFKHFDGG